MDFEQAAKRTVVKAKPGKTDRYEHVRAEKLSHLVAERLRARIAGGELSPGDTLPMEAELLKQLGVSRPTLREALRVLESEKLLQLGRGARSGATVLAPSIGMAARYGAVYLATQGTTLGEIHEVRTVLEPSLAAHHAANAKKAVIRTLQECVAAEEAALQARDYVSAVAAVNDFHAALVRHAPNKALELLAGMLHEISADLYPLMPSQGSRSEQQVVWRRTEKSVAAHAKLTELIAAGKGDEAERFWREYMLDTAAFLNKTHLGALRVQVPSHSR